MSIKAIVFDKDGTLLDYYSFWYPLACRATEIAYGEFGITANDVAEHVADLGLSDGKTDISGALPRGDHAGIVKALYERLCANGAECDIDSVVAAFAKGYSSEEAKSLGNVVPACDNIRELMLSLKKKGIRLALITLDDIIGTKICLAKLSIDDLFDEILAYDGKTPPKPAPDFMIGFMKKFSLDKSEVVMVGDTETDISFAKNSGVFSVGVGASEKSRCVLSAMGADVTLSDISELPAALGL